MTVSLKFEIISSSPPILSKVTSIDAGGMISPAMVDSYSSRSNAANCASDSPDCVRRVWPFCRAFLLDPGEVSMEERT